MRIGIDARFYQESGVGRYLRNLIDHLKTIDKKNEYFIFLLAKDYESFKPSANFQKVKADFSWYGIAEQLKFPKLLNKYQLDLVHFPHFNVPILYKGKFVVTIHDLIHQHFKMKRSTTLNPLFFLIKNLGYKKVFKHALDKSEKIITPSNFVFDLLIKEWNVKREKISVTYEGIEENIEKIVSRVTKAETDQVMNKFNITPPYIFYVGNAHPHKNVEGLIKVFKQLRTKYQYLQLVLTGSDHYFWQRIKKQFQHKDIIFTNKVSDIELVSLYKNAQVFVLPSFEEGFGIPLLEAMVCGTPVVSSKLGSLTEVGSDAAIYFDPHDFADMTLKIDTVLESDKLRKELIFKGKKRVKIFSFKKMATQTLEIYNKCL